MIPFVLPNIFYVCENCSNDEFVDHILPRLKPIMKVYEPIQVCILIIINLKNNDLCKYALIGSFHISSKNGTTIKISTTRRY